MFSTWTISKKHYEYNQFTIDLLRENFKQIKIAENTSNKCLQDL